MSFLATSLAQDFACLKAIQSDKTIASCVYPYDYPTKNLIDWVGCNFVQSAGRKWCYTEIESSTKRAWGYCPSECGIAKMIVM